MLHHQAASSGKLSETWYKEVSKLPPITDYDVMKGRRTYRYTDLEILYPFGHGLTYGELELAEVKLSQDVWQEDDNVTLTVKLFNDYAHPVTDTVQFYASIQPKQVLLVPKKQLIAFKKVTLKEGETREEILKLDPKELRYFDVAWNRFVFPVAEGTVLAGFSSEDIRQKSAFQINGESRIERDFKAATHFENYDDYKKATITWTVLRKKPFNCLWSSKKAQNKLA